MIHLIITNFNKMKVPKMKIKLTKGLTLNKEAITKLQDAQMSQIKGGNYPPEKEKTCPQISCWD
ncbi:class I lanthipeptide [Flavobacterium sp. SLB02]|uniref:class I lanthipeptide n=1 Tax=Flavobacterium sp. SLB02 TaxID=2665645 RepID=UPI0012A910B3|nr:class I lanthipeptide [Flavobacterium sp. SLB02]QGK74137.1 hypothetical protein GIY83_08730 [Flavobacterium sp. SLB02]